jgi:hypothetical protein
MSLLNNKCRNACIVYDMKIARLYRIEKSHEYDDILFDYLSKYICPYNVFIILQYILIEQVQIKLTNFKLYHKNIASDKYMGCAIL